MHDLAPVGMYSMLSGGTKTIELGKYEEIIHMALEMNCLFQKVLELQTHDMEHSSIHRVITSTFKDRRIENPRHPKLKFQKTDWKAIRSDLRGQLGPIEAIHNNINTKK